MTRSAHFKETAGTRLTLFKRCSQLVPRKCRKNSLQFAVARRSPYAVVRLGSSVPNQIQYDHERPLHASTTIQRMSKAQIISGETISSTGRHERHRGLDSINTPDTYARYMIQASGRNSNFALAALSPALAVTHCRNFQASTELRP